MTMELLSPPPTLRRNPPRKAKPTPATANPPRASTSLAINDFPQFPLLDLQPDLQIPPPFPSKSHQKTTTTNDCSENSSSSQKATNLNVFLRIRPLKTPRIKKNGIVVDSKCRAKHGVSTEKSSICLAARDYQSVTLTTPQSMLDSKRTKTEVYEGFTHVFLPNSLQGEVYERIMHPLVMDFIGGKSRLLVAMGPTGSGKTHTMFGSSRDPGLVPLALRHLFLLDENSSLPRSYFMSMFEIHSEGRGERMLDLSQDVADLCLQQSTIKGLQEVRVSSIVEAESLLARGMLKRATAVTNANSHSSRSQCIINIRRTPEMADAEVELPLNSAVLTFADLAGAERERRTGNQGARLLESNFINNTSMVFGLCLRSLLEHQRNRKMPLQKHFQNSLLTRYLRDYLEAKKWMTLILTLSPGEDDYLDTSFLLRQASPYMKIVFNKNELPSKPCQKRQHSALVRVNANKRRKCNDSMASMNNQGNIAGELVPEKELCPEEIDLPVQSLSPFSIPVNVKESGSAKLHAECSSEVKRRDRIDLVMRGFSKAMWSLLKDYKHKLEVSENEVQGLKESLKKENIRLFEIEKELEKLKASCICGKQVSMYAPSNHVDTGAEFCATGLSHVVGHIATNDIAMLEEQKISVISSPPLNPSQRFEGSEDTHNLRMHDPSTGELKSNPLLVGDILATMAIPDRVVDNASLFPGDIKRQTEQISGEELASSLDTKYVENFEGQNCLQVNGTLSNEVSEIGYKDTMALSVSSIPEKANNIFHSSENTSVVKGPMELAATVIHRESLQIDISSVSEVSDGKIGITRNESQHYEQESFNLRVQAVSKENYGSPKSLNPKKHRRKLLPASSMLLKEIENFALEDEVPKGGRAGRQKVSVEERGRSQGSISLVQLLRGNHPAK